MDLGQEVRKTMLDARREAEQTMKRQAGRDVQRKMDQFAHARKGQPVEAIRTDLASFWSQTVGQGLSDAQLRETAQAIHDGERIPAHVERIIWR